MPRVVVEWEANWSCPECGAPASSLDEGVEDENEYFDVVCENCDHEYEAYKDQRPNKTQYAGYVPRYAVLLARDVLALVCASGILSLTKKKGG